MSISAIVGLPGAGKSYLSVQRVILPALSAGRRVVTNVPVYADVIKRDYPAADLEVFETSVVSSDAEFFDRVPPGAVFVFDEAWQLWPSGLKMADAPLSWKMFLSQHRHRVDAKGRATEVILLTQDLGQLAAFVRALIETTMILTKLSALGSAKKSRIDVYQGVVTGSVGPKSRLLSQSYFQISEKFYQYYRSHTLSVAGLAGDETKVDRRGVLWKSPFFIAGVCFVLLSFGFGGYKILRLFSGKAPLVRSPGAVLSSVSRAPLPLAVVHAKQAVAVPPSPKYSSSWRLGGVVQFADGSGEAVLSFTDGTLRFISLSSCHPIKAEIAWECDLDGQLVTDWTGQARPNVTVQPVPTLIEPTQVPVAARSVN